jgi:hypothetical protein
LERLKSIRTPSRSLDGVLFAPDHQFALQSAQSEDDSRSHVAGFARNPTLRKKREIKQEAAEVAEIREEFFSGINSALAL